MDARARSSTVIAAAQISDAGEQWIELIPTAEKARNGRWYFTITRDDLDTWASSIADQAGLVPIDYDHEGAEGGSTVAAGWLTGETRIVAAGEQNPAGDTQEHTSLWGLAKWTPQAKQEIEDGRFKRMSPEFSFVEKDTKTGLMTKAKEFVASTLTNRPFFTQLAALAAAGDQVWDPEQTYQDLRSEVYEALNPGPSGALENARYWVCDVAASGDRALVQEYGPDCKTWVVPFTLTTDEDGGDGRFDVELAPADEWIEAEQVWVQAARARTLDHRKTLPFPGLEADHHEGDEGMPDLKMIAKKLGLADDATEEQVLAALETQTVAPDAVVLDKDTVSQLTASAKKGEDAHAELQTLKVKTLLDEAIRDFKILPAQRAAYEAMCAADFDGVKALFEATPKDAVVTSVRGSGSERVAGEVTDEDVEDVRTTFAGDLADVVDDEQARTHLKALELIGKPDFSGAEYATAFASAQKELGVVYRERPTDIR